MPNHSEAKAIQAAHNREFRALTKIWVRRDRENQERVRRALIVDEMIDGLDAAQKRKAIGDRTPEET